MLGVNKKEKSQKGFTLIELMITIAIIAILAAISIPQFSAYKTGSYNAAVKSDLYNLRVDMNAYFVEWGEYVN